MGGVLTPHWRETLLGLIRTLGLAASLKKRSRVDIYADILEVIKRRPEGVLVTRISYGAGLPIDRIKPILETLANFGLLSIRTAGESRYYHITRRGLEFLDAYRKVQGFMTFLGSEQS
jgi:predicted transcriptional regulator